MVQQDARNELFAEVGGARRTCLGTLPANAEQSISGEARILVVVPRCCGRVDRVQAESVLCRES